MAVADDKTGLARAGYRRAIGEPTHRVLPSLDTPIMR